MPRSRSSSPWSTPTGEGTSSRPWRFVPRPGATFHGGEPLTAEDVCFSFGRARTPRRGSPPRRRDAGGRGPTRGPPPVGTRHDGPWYARRRERRRRDRSRPGGRGGAALGEGGTMQHPTIPAATLLALAARAVAAAGPATGDPSPRLPARVARCDPDALAGPRGRALLDGTASRVPP